MSETTNISWCDATWNPWRGCAKVSPGCANCYAEKLVTTRLGGQWGKGAPRVRASAATFGAPLRWNRKPWICECGTAMQDKIKGPWSDCDHKPHRRRVFLGSLMDWLDPEVPVEWLADALHIMRRCPELVFQCVTKRPELWLERIKSAQNHICKNIKSSEDTATAFWLQIWIGSRRQTGPLVAKPPANVHVIVSVENQATYWDRQAALLDIPSRVKGLSVEPLLEEIDLELRHGCRSCNHPGNIVMAIGPDGQCSQCGGTGHEPSGIDWVIVGGESGLGRRDCGVEAIVGVVEQCQSAGVPCFVKQDCAARPGMQGRILEEVWRMKQFPRK